MVKKKASGRRTRRTHTPLFKARVALNRGVRELAYGGPPSNSSSHSQVLDNRVFDSAHVCQ